MDFFFTSVIKVSYNTVFIQYYVFSYLIGSQIPVMLEKPGIQEFRNSGIPEFRNQESGIKRKLKLTV